MNRSNLISIDALGDYLSTLKEDVVCITKEEYFIFRENILNVLGEYTYPDNLKKFSFMGKTFKINDNTTQETSGDNQ